LNLMLSFGRRAKIESYDLNGLNIEEKVNL
jgi:hypothetical protein